MFIFIKPYKSLFGKLHPFSDPLRRIPRDKIMSKPMSLLELSPIDDDDFVPGLIGKPHSLYTDAFCIPNTPMKPMRHDEQKKGVKTLMDIIKQDATVHNHVRNLVSSATPPFSMNEQPELPIPKLVRQQAIHPPMKGCCDLMSVDKRSENVVKDTVLNREILPGWRISDAMVDGIVMGMVVFPWPLWVAIFMVAGVRVPTIMLASSKID